MAAFEWLRRQVDIRGDVLPRELLRRGFEFEDKRIPLVSPQGIFKPRSLDLPLTITTAPGGPYDDHFGDDGLLRYRYRGTDPEHRDNVGLRQALLDGVPLIYLHGIARSRYLAVWPVYIVGDEPGSLTFSVAVDNAAFVAPTQSAADSASEARRVYVTREVRARLHQRTFRERVIKAYREQCSLCRLRHTELLDAAHIVPDADPHGEPVVRNGIALCKLHHAAFDRFVLGITPEYTVEIREDILHEIDGPMLEHGLKEMHGQQLMLPKRRADRPDRDLLDLRYQKFRSA
ncbi:MAG: HNH endonuclease [Rhodothermales bacterium]|nr:HNH endonuclease [Rhodothermales bacterium]